MALVRELEGLQNELEINLMARVSEIAIRLATIVTIGQGLVEIEKDTMQWAIDFARWHGMRLVKLAKGNISDSDTQTLANDIKRVIAKKTGKGWIKMADIWLGLRYKHERRKVEDVMRMLMASGELIQGEKKNPPGGGPVTQWFKLQED